MCQNSEFQRASSRVVVWRRREGLTSHATLQVGEENCAEEDCSLRASSRRCGTVSRREIAQEWRIWRSLEQRINKLLESAKGIK